MRLLLLRALFAIVLTSSYTLAQDSSKAIPVSSETHTAVSKLIGDVIVNGKAYDYDRHLADNIGPRLTGSDNYVHAVSWTVEQFKSLGLKNVHTEPFTMPALWEPEIPATGNILEPRNQALHIYSAGWSPSTPVEGITGKVTYLSHLLPAEKLDAAKIAGSILLIDRASYAGAASLGDLIRALSILNGLGPKAVLLTGGANGTENAISLTVTGELSAMPVAQIGREDELLIKRMLGQGPVTIHFSFKNRVRPATQVDNVVAEIPGREEPGSIVIVGAHLDSWHPATGAQDNGTGVAAILDIARAVQSLGLRPRRTIRFILFGGEEEGFLGSNSYVKRHAADLASIDAVLVSDTGAQLSKGWYVMGRSDEEQALANIEPLLAGLGSNATSPDTDHIFGTDHAGFNVAGIPTLVLWSSLEEYSKLHHQAADSFDSVVQANLVQATATTAATAYAIADSVQPLAPHDSPAQVEDMLNKVGELDDYKALKAAGVIP